ncbi:hypothetical protein ACNDGK_003517, partial [Shigella flexneri]
TNRKIDTGKTLTRWPVFVDHFTASVLMLEKQRNGEGWEGGVPLFLDEQSHQFLQLESGSPYSYIANMPKSEYDEAWRQENVTEY